MRLYLASSFSLRAEVEKVCLSLTAAGHTIPDHWWLLQSKEIPTSNDTEWMSHPLIETIAMRHWRQIDKADALVLVSHPEQQPKFNGANVEIGYAIAKGIPVFCIGALERSAMYAPVIHCPTLDQLEECLGILESRETQIYKCSVCSIKYVKAKDALDCCWDAKGMRRIGT